MSEPNTIHIRGYQQLDEIIRDKCIREDDNHRHLYGKYYNYGVAGLKEFNHDIMNEPKRAILPVDTDLNRVYLPRDYVNYISIGICREGNIYALGYNPRMCKMVDDCGDFQKVEGGNVKGSRREEGPEVSWGFYSRFGATGSYLGRQGGHGGGYNGSGYYGKIRKDEGWIDLSSTFEGDEVILDYITTGYEPGKTTWVHVHAKEALIAYIDWKVLVIRSRQEKNLINAREDSRREFFRLKKNLRQRRTNNTLYEITAAARRSYKTTAKF